MNPNRRQLFASIAGALAAPSLARAQSPGMSRVTAFAFSFAGLEGGDIRLSAYAGKPILVVNTASLCGYTPQYAGLQQLWTRYHDRGLMIVGVPSNDFGGQEPGSNKEIAEFCRLTYGVEFPMFEKSSVTSIKTNPLYAELLARTGQSPKWNFHKYLVDRDGKQVTSFGTRVEPDNGDLIGAVERMLAAKPALPKS